MEITLNGNKHTIPDSSTHVAVDRDGECFWFTTEPAHEIVTWNFEWGDLGFMCDLAPPADFTKCCAKVFDGAVIDFEVR